MLYGQEAEVSETNRLASWWVPPIRIRSGLSAEEAWDALQSVAVSPSLWRRLFGRRVFRRIQEDEARRRFRIVMTAPALSGIYPFVPIAKGSLRPAEGGCILEVEFKPRVSFVLLLCGVLVIPGVLDRSAWFMGLVFVFIAVLMASVYVVAPEADELKRALVSALRGAVEDETSEAPSRTTRG